MQTTAKGSDEHKQKPKLHDPRDNEASWSKGKEKLVNDDEEEEEDENAKLKRKYCDAKIDENLRIAKEAKAREKEARKAQDTLKTQKSLFPSWSIEWILNEAIDNPSVDWMETVTSFELEITLDS